MAVIPVKIKLPKVSSGTIRAFIFILLVGITIAFWLYTQLIINHVREFQKSVITTQKSIYISIINPLSADVSGIDSELIQKGVIDSPFPIIFSDTNNNPVQGRWRNVGIAPDDTSEASIKRLKKIIEKMDRINPPDSIPNPTLIHRTDSLTVYEIPPSKNLPVTVTDLFGTPLYWRNIPVRRTRTLDGGDIGPSVLRSNTAKDEADSINIIMKIKQFDTEPIRFNKENEPPLNFYGMSGFRKWPLIVAKNNGDPLYWKDVGVAQNDTSSSGKTRLSAQMRYMRPRGIVYNLVTENIPDYDILLFHYGDPKFLTWIVWLPVIEFIVIFILISIGFIGFKNITNAEQRSIWVGMAKETAHQLGTPISSINGWLELLKTERDVSLINQAVNEMECDTNRLTRVAARFSNIGSKPELQPIKVSDVIDEVLDYFRTRVPRMGRSVHLESHIENLSDVLGNRELLNWAFENLVKNALTAIEIKDGRIVVTGMISKNFKQVILDFEDNGKGITFADQKKIMKPGYTTKTRGWGLGLSLVKRIIEDYHGGKVMLLESKPGVGSTFRVIIPAVEIKGNV